MQEDEHEVDGLHKVVVARLNVLKMVVGAMRNHVS
jgi:hypothetical protein